MKTRLFRWSLLFVFLSLTLSACATPTPVPTLASTSTMTTVPSLVPTSMPTVTPSATPTSRPTSTPLPPTSTSTPVPATLTPIPPPQPNVELRFFFDWNPQEPFNLQATGLNSKRDPGEPILSGFTFSIADKSYITDGDGIARLILPTNTLTITISVPNTNKSVGQKNLANLGLQFTMTMYEPNRVNYGPRFLIDFRDNHCQTSGGLIACEIGIADGYLTSPYQGENYLYSSPWSYDSGLNYDKDFVNALNNGLVPSPTGGMYQLGGLGKLIASYANTRDRGVPYGYPYLLKDPTLGIVSHLLMDVRNDLGVAIYAPVGGTICKGNSSDYAICAGDVTIDINDIRVIPNWQSGLKVKRGQLIGWTDPINNITGQTKPFPLIHMGNFEHRDRGMTLARYPDLSAEQIVMGAKPGSQGQIYLAPKEQIVANYDFKVHLPHAPVYTER